MANEDMLHPYDDILHLPHHVSAKRTQMPIADRAAQFSPFAALTGYDDAVKETARLTDEQIELDENSKTILNEKLEMILERLGERPSVQITYFRPDDRKAGGAYVAVTGIVRKVDAYERTVMLEDGTRILLDRIYDICEFA